MSHIICDFQRIHVYTLTQIERYRHFSLVMFVSYKYAINMVNYSNTLSSVCYTITKGACKWVTNSQQSKHTVTQSQLRTNLATGDLR